jgi:hypothetical protein
MRIYLDHNATTPGREEVADARDRARRELYGNPSSVHEEGAAARAGVGRAGGDAAVAGVVDSVLGELMESAEKASGGRTLADLLERIPPLDPGDVDPREAAG